MPFNERLSRPSVIRSDGLKRTIRPQIGHDPVTGYSPYGGFDPALKANRAGCLEVSKDRITSANVGLVGCVLPWLALPANYSENFGQPTTGVNQDNGDGFDPTRGKGRDFGPKFPLPSNKLYAVPGQREGESAAAPSLGRQRAPREECEEGRETAGATVG